MSLADLPILSPSSLDFARGSYTTDIALESSGERSAWVVRANHVIEGENLISKMLVDREAMFVTEICSPSTAYREAHPAEERGVTSTAQSLEIPNSLLSPPIWSRMLVVATPAKSTKTVYLSEESGTHEIWRGKKVEVHPGSVLAVSDFYRTSGMASLLRLSESKNLNQGSLKVDVMESAEDIYIEVQAHPSLFNWLKNPGEHIAHRQTILTCALAGGLDTIRERYKVEESTDWTSHPVLRELDKYLKDNGLPALDSPETSFNSLEVATQLKPIEFDEQ